MGAMADTSPAPARPSVGERIGGRFDLSDRRTLVGLGVLAFCAGVMVGARLMRGAVPAAELPGTDNGGLGGNPAVPSVVFRDVPCRECAEKHAKEGAAIIAEHNARAVAQASAEAAAARAQHAAEPVEPLAPSDEVAADIAARAAMAELQRDVQPAPKRFSPMAEVDVLPEDVVRDQYGRPVG